MLIKNTTTFGLTERDSTTISDILRKYPEVIEVYIFGSRAKGTNKQYSDIDLAIMKGNAGDKTILKIKSDLDDSTLPYSVDLIDYINLTQTELKEHIDRVGILFYKRAE